MNQDRKQTQAIRVLSGIQPTGELHLGNYMGAVRHWVKRRAHVESLFLLADLHAITLPQNPRELRQKTLSTAALLVRALIHGPVLLSSSPALPSMPNWPGS